MALREIMKMSEARTAMMTIVTSNSTRVNPLAPAEAWIDFSRRTGSLPRINEGEKNRLPQRATSFFLGIERGFIGKGIVKIFRTGQEMAIAIYRLASAAEQTKQTNTTKEGGAGLRDKSERLSA